MNLYDIAIIGGGAAGQMAMLRGVLYHLNTVVFLGDAQSNRKSRAQWVVIVENIPGMFDLKRPITKTTKDTLSFIEQHEDLKSHLTSHKKAVTNITKDADGFFTLQAGDESYRAKYVVLCTGTMDIQPEIQGTIKTILPYANKEDVMYCIRCDGHKTVGKNCAVIGHKSVAAWIAVMLKERYDLPKLWVLTNGKAFEGSDEINGLIEKYQIEVIEDPIEEILGEAKTGMVGFKVGGKTVPAPKAFVALGSIVYNELAKQLGAKLNERDHLITDDKMQTSVDGFYAAGDLVAGKKKQVYTSWDMAVDAVDHVDGRIRKAKRG
jgi:thioredoxin reductase (NADPH)